MDETSPLMKRSNKDLEVDTYNSDNKLPESPRLPMEFLSRSWSLSALQLSRALSPPPPGCGGSISPCSILEEENYATAEKEDHEDVNHPHHCHGLLLRNSNDNIEISSINGKLRRINQNLAGNSFSFPSPAVSQLILERIMSQADVSPLTSGRSSCREPPLMGVGGGKQSCSSPLSAEQVLLLDSQAALSSSPPGHHESDDKLPNINHKPRPKMAVVNCGGGSCKTVGRWLKERRKHESSRTQNVDLHAAISLALVAATIAASATATASASSTRKDDEQVVLTDATIASATTLVAAQCAEVAEAMGEDHDQLAAVIRSAVNNVQSYADIITLTAAATTAVRRATRLKAVKEVCSIAAVLPLAVGRRRKGEQSRSCLGSSGFQFEPFEGMIVAGDLLKRTRKGEFLWKIVSVYINKADQVILKMKSRHVAGTLAMKKKKILLDVCKNMAVWPDRYPYHHHVNYGEQERRYFGLKTVTHRIIQFECKDQEQHDFWIRGVSRLLALASERRRFEPRPC